ncbi:M23 family metallopeptidase [Crassaminicella thermophila]|uniref:M23 family metallopeptidase n=1 Tax=Crassaminicella thermophila TaxID=2599308 RepID=A0A5C0SGE3_CRATE|nr:M23 family metallopeptidase [Crassaminicella thermophila]QEK12298.1 M23 family metallopeptidase [Crassaminicella thermophila]
MNKLYRKINSNRQKISNHVKRKNYNNRGSQFYKRTLKQIVLCILIVLLVIFIKNINSPITNKTKDVIKISLTKEINLKKSIKQIMVYVKEIPKMHNKVTNVFNAFSKETNSSIKFIVPLKGEIISNYGESRDPILNIKTFQRGVDILVNKDESIVSVADGEIIQIGEGKSLGKYIKVKHKNNMVSFYANCSHVKVKKGQIVKKGEEIATIYKPNKNENTYLHFELWKEGKVVDPTKYIPFDRKIL